MAVDHSQDEVVVLADRVALTAGKVLRTQLFILIATMAVTAWLFWHLMAPFDWFAAGWRNLLQISLQFLFVLVIVAVQLFWTNRARRLERLVLSPTGIQYVSPLPQRLKWISPDCTLEWGQISSVGLSIPKGVPRRPELVTMTIVAGTRTKKIQPVRWVDPDTYAPSPDKPWWKFERGRFRPEGQGMMEAVSASAVVRYVARRIPQLAIDSRLAEKETMTALENNPHGRVAIAILFLLFAYMLLDLMLGPESYLDAPSTLIHIYALTGIIAAALSAIWLAGSSLKTGEKAGLAMLLGLMASAAMLPGALRINALFDSHGLVTYDCRVIQDARHVTLQPFAAGIPPVDYFAANPYWSKFGKGDVYEVRIRRGILSFYQFDSATIIERIHNDK